MHFKKVSEALIVVYALLLSFLEMEIGSEIYSNGPSLKGKFHPSSGKLTISFSMLPLPSKASHIMCKWGLILLGIPPIKLAPVIGSLTFIIIVLSHNGTSIGNLPNKVNHIRSDFFWLTYNIMIYEWPMVRNNIYFSPK